MQIDHEEDRQRCQYVGCTCSVPAGQPYCGEHCRLAARGEPDSDEEPDACACGHNECAEHQ